MQGTARFHRQVETQHGGSLMEGLYGEHGNTVAEWIPSALRSCRVSIPSRVLWNAALEKGGRERRHTPARSVAHDLQLQQMLFVSSCVGSLEFYIYFFVLLYHHGQTKFVCSYRIFLQELH